MVVGSTGRALPARLSEIFVNKYKLLLTFAKIYVRLNVEAVWGPPYRDTIKQKTYCLIDLRETNGNRSMQNRCVFCCLFSAGRM